MQQQGPEPGPPPAPPAGNQCILGGRSRPQSPPALPRPVGTGLGLSKEQKKRRKQPRADLMQAGGQRGGPGWLGPPVGEGCGGAGGVTCLFFMGKKKRPRPWPVEAQRAGAEPRAPSAPGAQGAKPGRGGSESVPGGSKGGGSGAVLCSGVGGVPGEGPPGGRGREGPREARGPGGLGIPKAGLEEGILRAGVSWGGAGIPGQGLEGGFSRARGGRHPWG